MNKIILRYGLYSGAAAAALMLATGFYLKSSDTFNGSAFWGYVGILISLIFVFVGVRTYREEVCGGQITFLEALKVGSIMALISCVCYALTWLLVDAFLLHDFMDKYAQHYIEQLRTAQKPEAEIQKAMTEMEDFKKMYANPIIKFGLTLMEPLPVALVVVLAAAGILRRNG
jgi:hypothetical protein